MERTRLDRLAKTLAEPSNRRTALRGIAALVVGGVLARSRVQEVEAAWSTLVCLPGPEGVTARLVPTASVPFYVQRYGAVIAENDVCPECLSTAQCPVFTTCAGGVCVDPCTLLDCSCSPIPGECARYLDGSATCVFGSLVVCDEEKIVNCSSDEMCKNAYGADFRCAISTVSGTPSAVCDGYDNLCYSVEPIVCAG